MYILLAIRALSPDQIIAIPKAVVDWYGMELLLNLVWLMLALPAVLLLRRGPVLGRSSGYLGRSRSFLILGCVLVLLFPVVSVTDDLHALRQEMEESSPSKRMVKQAPAPKSPVWGDVGHSRAQLVQVHLFGPGNETCGMVSPSRLILPTQARAHTAGGRAPPLA